MARLGQGSLRSPCPSLVMLFAAVIVPECYIIGTLFFFQRLILPCPKLLSKTPSTFGLFIPQMLTLCFHALNQLCELEGDLYFNDHNVHKIKPQKSHSQMTFCQSSKCSFCTTYSGCRNQESIASNCVLLRFNRPTLLSGGGLSPGPCSTSCIMCRNAALIIALHWGQTRHS